MKVILLQDVKGSGKKGDIIEASDGHARNYLIPRKLAVEASKANMSELEHKKRAEESKRQSELLKAQALAAKIGEKVITVQAKLGENGKLFGSITSKEIAQALEEQTGLQIDKKKIVLDEPIKSIGEKKVDVKVHPQVIAKIRIEITGA